MSPQRERLKLRSLAPQYEAEHHAVYIQALEDALADSSTARNIALTGAYGTGKSSVLEELRNRKDFDTRVLVLSLSTVGKNKDLPATGDRSEGSAKEVTDRIQQEIVKQILYRDAPHRTRGSRFRRIARFTPWPEFGLALCIGLVGAAALFLTGWTGPLSGSPGRGWRWLLGEHVAVALLVAAAVFGIRRWASGRVTLEKLSAGPATVAVGSHSTSYFDQYMDEIVYFFEESGRDIVVFEDIDRFDDVHIFETLRALNTLLNNAQQVTNRRGHRYRLRKKTVPPVRFIYALRDSIFERIGTGGEAVDAAEEEVRRANRTKFFDLVIPVVPFVTHRNARDVMSNIFYGTAVSQRLIALAAGHVADKRLLLNLRNEFDVYADRLLHTSSIVPGLNADKLLAVLLYKSVHLADFEAIRTGTSRLDQLHDAWRDLVEACTSQARGVEQGAERRMQPAGSSAHRAQELGDRLEDVAREALGQYSRRGMTVIVDGVPYSPDQLRQVTFWESVTRSTQDVIFDSNITNVSTARSVDGLALLMDRSLDAAEWAQVDHDEQVKIRDAARDDIYFLRHHTWQQLYERPDLNAAVADQGEENFASVVRRSLKSRLAQELVAHGHLDDYFALYVSMYYGQHLRPDALNFLVHALDRGRADTTYTLNAEDVRSILRDRGDVILQDRAAYNVNILDHLLAEDDHRAMTLVQLVSAWGDDDRSFAQEYLASGADPAAFLSLLSPLVREVVPFVLDCAAVAEDERPALVDAVLSNQDPDLEYVRSPRLPAYAVEHFRSFPSLVSGRDAVRTEKTVAALAAEAVELPDVVPLSDNARKVARRHGVYELTEGNLQALSEGVSVALDVLSSRHEELYQRSLQQLSKYLRLIAAAPDRQSSVQGPENLAAVLRDAHTTSSDANTDLRELVRLAAPDCRVDDLAKAPSEAWPALCGHRRTDLTFSNLLCYLDAFGGFDDDVADLIGEARQLSFGEDDEVADRRRVAVALVNAGQPRLDATHRVELASSLDAAPLPVAELRGESGELAGLLLSAGLVPDDASTFASPLVPDWTAREFALLRSAAFADFCSPEVLPADELAAFFESGDVPPSLQAAVLGDLDLYADQDDQPAHVAAAEAALRCDAQLTESLLTTLAEGGAGDSRVVDLIARAPGLSPTALRNVLGSLGGGYATIAASSAPKAAIPAGEANKALLVRLRRTGSSFTSKTKGNRIEVSLR